jgi:hypothetical protein
MKVYIPEPPYGNCLRRTWRDPMKLPAPAPVDASSVLAPLEGEVASIQSTFTGGSLASIIMANPIDQKAAKEVHDSNDVDSWGSPESNHSDEDPEELQPSTEGQQIAFNTGSLGHPNFCLRPCLYFAQGTCSNGVDCGFCHLPHNRRSAHLDKRHRLCLSNLSFFERLKVILPAIEERASSLALQSTLASITEIKRLMHEDDRLNSLLQVEDGAANTPTRRAARENKRIRAMLRGFRVPELFKWLNPQQAPASTQKAIQALQQLMHEEGMENALAADEKVKDSLAQSDPS